MSPTFHFDEINHLYWENGVWTPSTTQCLKLQGLVDFSMVKPEVLAAKSILGTEVHSLTESHDLYGEIDPSWLTDENTGYYNAWLKFKSESGFVPIKEYVEWQTIASLYGYRYGVKIDCLGMMAGEKVLAEKKCSDTVQNSWAIQTAAQEMAITGRPRCGELKRLSVRLRKNGAYRVIRYNDHQSDCMQFTSALVNVHGRLAQGQRLWERIAA